MQLQNILNLNFLAFVNNFLTLSIFNSMTCHVISNKLLSPAGIFFFFSLGHSKILVIVSECNCTKYHFFFLFFSKTLHSSTETKIGKDIKQLYLENKGKHVVGPIFLVFAKNATTSCKALLADE